MTEDVVDVVRQKYGAVAASDLSGDHAGVREVAEAFGYTPDELAAVPAGAHMGLSCGNPTASAHLRPGEMVVDLGCGGASTCCSRPGKSARPARPSAST